jgi:lysophospholipase L1-like esterase
MRFRRVLAATVLVIIAAACTPLSATAASPSMATFDGWSATWGTPQNIATPVGPWSGNTMRMVVRTSVGGSQMRIDLANPYVTTPAAFDHATVAIQRGGDNATSTPVTLTFDGSDTVTIPAGGAVVSDPAAMPVPANTRLFVSLYTAPTANIQNAPMHQDSLETEYNHWSADVSGAQTFPSTMNSFTFTTYLDRVDVATQTPATVIAIGDSITAGMGTPSNTDTQWTSYLADQIAPTGIGVINEGITTDQVIASASGAPSIESRWQHDVLDTPGAQAVIDAGGINDLRAGVSAATLEAAQTSLAASAHAAGIKVFFTTLTPCAGVTSEPCTATFETQRLAYNAWVRAGAGGLEDGYCDFNAAVTGGGSPAALASAYDSGDHIHPNSAGNAVMANACPDGAL